MKNIFKDKTVTYDSSLDKIDKETARRNIAQWLFVHAQEADSPAWRESLLEMIDWNIKHIK